MSDVNRKIAELCGWTDIHEDEWWEEDFYGDGFTKGLVGVSPNGEGLLPLPDYQHSLDAAVQAAGELLNYGLCIFLNPDNPHITYKNGKRDEFGDLWTSLPVKSNDPADIAAAICEAILQARGQEVQEVSDGE